MQFSKILSVFSLAAAASATTVGYDQGYDNAARPLTEVACSDGVNGLIWKYNWKVQGDVKRFPYIGGAQAVEKWNSANCGTCWSASYNGKTIYILAVDHADQGLNIGLTAFNDLTSGHGVEIGRIDANVQQVALGFCGL